MLPERDTLLRAIEDLDTTIAEYQSNNAVLATPPFLPRLEELEAKARVLGEPALIAMIEKLRRHITTGMGSRRLSQLPQTAASARIESLACAAPVA